jgi:hypothetical protein
VPITIHVKNGRRIVDLFLHEEDEMIKRWSNSNRRPSGPTLAVAIRQRASQHLSTSLDLTQ